MALYSPDGTLAASYSKIHLFRLMDEDQYLAPGEAGELHELPWGCAGLAICYDLRFPELFRRYALEGARLLILPAEWPHPRRMHWRTLLRSRAIENQCFVAACNRVGTTEGVTFFGSSAVIDPWGETLIEGGETEALLTVRIDLNTVEATRAKIPILADRRPELYWGSRVGSVKEKKRRRHLHISPPFLLSFHLILQRDSQSRQLPQRASYHSDRSIACPLWRLSALNRDHTIGNRGPKVLFSAGRTGAE